MKITLTGLSQRVFLDRYALKDKEGKPIEQSPEEMWRRVARGIASAEKTQKKRAEWEEKFYHVMEDFKFLPGGRIFAGAGTGYDVTYYNCFVIPNPKDSRDGIMSNLTSMIEIMARGGGVGVNLSSLRPRGSRVKKVNGFSSGPLNWAELYSLATKDIVQQGGSRRGALMLMLHDWHPDIEEFITVKQDLSKINGANLSVCVSDGFMEAVKKDADWDLVYPDLDDPKYDTVWNGEIDEWRKAGGKVRVVKTIKAKFLWDLICTAAWRSAEPGLHFLERSNKHSNTHYFEKLIATNPSLRAGTRVLTQEGIFPIEQLEGKRFLVKNLDGKWSEAECFLSGKNKELYKLTLNNGKEIYATAEHKWPVALMGGGFGKVTTDKLKSGNILPFPKADDVEFNSAKNLSREEGFMVGWLYGDGWISERSSSIPQPLIRASRSLSRVASNVRNYSSFVSANNFYAQNNSQKMHELLVKDEERKKMVFGFLFSEEDKILAGAIEEEVNKLKREKSELKRAHDNTYTIQSTSFEFAENLSNRYGVDKKEKGLPFSVWESGSAFIKGFVDGLISSDGFIAKDAYRIVFTTKHKKIADDFSTLLSFYGIKSNVRKSEATRVKFPNQKEYSKIYERYDVTIDGFNAVSFGKIFTLSHPRKQALLQRIVNEHTSSRALPDHELIRIKSVEKTDIKENVWDISVYDNTHCFYIEHVVTGNCGEQPLSAWAVCNLGAMNLSVYVREEDVAAEKAGWFDYEAFGQDVQVAMRFLDNVIDQTYYFLDENEKCAKDIRRTGLGIMGLGDTLIKMKLRYGADESLPVIEKIFKTLRDNAYIASSDIAAEKGAFPKFDKVKYLEGHHIKALPKKIQDMISKQGIRNAVLLTIAPTGTTSLLAGVTSGIEPVYEFEFIRKSKLGIDKLYHPLFQEWKEVHPSTGSIDSNNSRQASSERPAYFVSANDLTPLDHVRVQAIAQEYIDSSISKTVNAPNKHTVADVEELYMAAYDMGLKGITYMRDGSRQGVLQREDSSKSSEQAKKEEASVKIPLHPDIPRPMMVQGVTYKTDSPLGKIYVTINHDEKGNPFEVFITIGKGGSDVAAIAEGLSRMISFVLRLHSTIPPKERMTKVISELAGIGGSRAVGFGENRVRSLPDAVAKVLARYLNHMVNKNNAEKLFATTADTSTGLSVSNGMSNGHAAANGAVEQLSLQSAESALPAYATKTMDICPSCGSATLAHEEGCSKCYSCGFAQC